MDAETKALVEDATELKRFLNGTDSLFTFWYGDYPADRGPLWWRSQLDRIDRLTDHAQRQAATIERLSREVEGLRHTAGDLVQHIDWLTSGLPKILDDGGLTDEQGLIGAAVDAAKSARAALHQEPTDGQ